MANKPAIIFDFDGTLADSLLATIHILYRLTHNNAMPAEDVSQFRGMTVVQILRRLHIPLWQALFLKQKVYGAMRDQMDHVALIPGMDEAVRALAANHRLFVVSSNDAPNVRLFLGRFQLERYFAGIYGDANPLRKAKVLREAMQENSLTANNTWYVGDQPWDVHAAHRAGMKAVAVTWGFSNLHVLKASRPEALAFSPDELVQYIDT